jgi:RNA polymerase sigma-70 factor (ECF subfamily)
MLLKKQKRRTEIETELARNAKHDQSKNADLLEASELRDVVDKTLDQLPDRSATIFRMSRYEGKKYREIAEELSISIKTVESNMGKALELFRKNLQEYL